MARSEMATLIQKVRALTNAGSADYTAGTITYWTDDQLQSVLDRYQVVVKHYPLEYIPETDTDGSTIYKEYRIPVLEWIEEDLIVEHSDGEEVASANYTVNYDSRIISFSADTGGSTLYIDANVYNVYHAAADVFEEKAGQVMNTVDWSSDNHSIKASQEAANYENQARRMRSKGGGIVGKFVRVDER